MNTISTTPNCTTKDLAQIWSKYNGAGLRTNADAIHVIAEEWGIPSHESGQGWDVEWWDDEEADTICLIDQGQTDPRLVGRRPATGTVTVADMRDYVQTCLTDNDTELAGGATVEGIVDAIIADYGYIDIATLDEDTLWGIVRVHDATQLAPADKL